MPLLEKEFPKHLADKVVDVMHLDEHLADHDVLVRLLGDYRSGGLATVGAENVLSAFERGKWTRCC